MRGDRGALGAMERLAELLLSIGSARRVRTVAWPQGRAHPDAGLVFFHIFPSDRLDLRASWLGPPRG